MVVIQLGCTARTERLYYSYKLIVPAVQDRCTDDTEDVYDSEKETEAVVIAAVEEELSYVEEGDFVLS